MLKHRHAAILANRLEGVAEQGWEETLRGQAAQIYDRWRKELKPQGVGLSAPIVGFEDGIMSDIGLFLTWGSSSMHHEALPNRHDGLMPVSY